MTIHPDFPWRAGMLAFNPHNARRYRLVQDIDGQGWWAVMTEATTELRGRLDQCEPDLTDDATLGALLGAVREAWAGWPVVCVQYRGSKEAWEVIGRRKEYRDRYDNATLGGGPTEADALLAAWNARPRSTA